MSEVTNRLFKYLNPELRNYIKFRGWTIVGYMESGKTTLALTTAAILEEKRSGDIIVLKAQKFGDILHYIEDNTDEVRGFNYAYIILDDAVRYAHSRSRKEQDRDIADYFEIRHFFEDVWKRGVVTTVYITQRWRSLDVVFRNAYAVTFKTIVSHDSEELKMLARTLRNYYRYLLDLTDRIYVYNDDEAKKYSVLRWGNGFLQELEVPIIARPSNIIEIRHAEEEDSVPKEKVDMNMILLGAYLALRKIGYKKTEAYHALRKMGFRFTTKKLIDIVSSTNAETEILRVVA